MDHVQTIKSTIRPFLSQRKARGGAFVAWAEVSNEKASTLFDNLFTLSKDVARSLDDLLGIDCQCRYLLQHTHLSLSLPPTHPTLHHTTRVFTYLTTCIDEYSS